MAQITSANQLCRSQVWVGCFFVVQLDFFPSESLRNDLEPPKYAKQNADLFHSHSSVNAIVCILSKYSAIPQEFIRISSMRKSGSLKENMFIAINLIHSTYRSTCWTQ